MRLTHTIKHSPEIGEDPAPKIDDFFANQVMGKPEAKEIYEAYAQSV
jgi:hypothetical protein